MKIPAALRIGWRYANSRRANHFIAFINFFSIAGIALGLAALIVVSSVMNGFEEQLKRRILGIVPHFIVAAAPKAVADDIGHHPAIRGIVAFAELDAVVQSPFGLQPVLVQGVNATEFKPFVPFPEQAVAGTWDDLHEGSFKIVIGRTLAMKLAVNVGDQIRLLTASNSRYTPLGRIPAQRLFRISGIFEMGTELDARVVFVELADLTRLLRTTVNDQVQTRLFMDDPFQYPALRSLLDQQGWQYQDWRARQGALFDAVRMEKNMMSLMLLLIIAVAAFNIVSALVMVVAEKRGDIAILRTQGLTANGVLTVFMVNGISNGVKGTVIGCGLGFASIYCLNPLMRIADFGFYHYLPEQHLPIAVDGGQVLLMVCLSLLLSLLAALYPAYRAAAVQPADALRYE